jgi:hypothetical protein
VLLRDVTPTLGDIVRGSDGSIRHMNQYDADAYCHAQGMRLPNARELALVSMSHGAAGIRETAHAGVAVSNSAVQAEIAQMQTDRFYPIYAANSAHQPVIDFYFSRSGYRRPSGDEGSYWLWSSSVLPVVSSNAYGFGGGGGGIYGFDRRDSSGRGAVLCVR